MRRRVQAACGMTRFRHICTTFLLAFVVLPAAAVAFQDSLQTTKKTSEEPEFEEPIGNKTFSVGREAVLGCTVSSLGKYKVGWLRSEDQTVLSLHTRVVMHSPRFTVHLDPPRTWQLRIRPLREADRGCYMCQINSPTMKNMCRCLQVGWLRAEDQTVLSLHTRVVTHSPRFTVHLDPPRTWQLRIRPLREADRGCYMCQINSPTMKKQIGCIDVHVPPDIVNDDTSTDVAVQEHDNATLTCKATGHPPPKITWRREDHEPILLKKPGSRDLYKVDTYTDNVLTLWKIDRRQMGAFLCIASNDVPPAVSKRITLSVNFAPTVKVPNQLLGAPLDTDVQLECYVEAFPNTINYWVKNRGEMLLDGNKYSIREDRSSYKVFMWLTIKKFSKQDIGTYNCVSTNSLGKSEGTLRLYEIKLYPNMQGSNHPISVVGGLVEAAKSANSEKEEGDGGSACARGTALLTLVSLTLLELIKR